MQPYFLKMSNKLFELFKLSTFVIYSFNFLLILISRASHRCKQKLRQRILLHGVFYGTRRNADVY